MKTVGWMPRSVRGALSWAFRPEEYVLLTSSPSAPRTTIYRRRHPCSWRNFIRMFTLRRVLISVTLVPVFLLLAIICQGIPPNYDDIRTFEQRLPQHSLSLVPRNQPQYLRFPGHLWGYGFNNVLQEACVPFSPTCPIYHLSSRTIRGHIYHFHGRFMTSLCVPHTYP